MQNLERVGSGRHIGGTLINLQDERSFTKHEKEFSMTNEIVSHVRHNMKNLRFTFTHVDNTVTVKLNDEPPWEGELTIPKSRYDKGPREYEIDALEPGENRIQVTANDTGGSAALIGKLTVEYDDGSEEVVTEWDYYQAQGPGDTFIEETIMLIYDDSTSATVTDVILTFTQIDDRVEVFLNGSSEPAWSNKILRYNQSPVTWQVSPLKAGMNELEVKAFNTAGSATLYGSVEFHYSDGRRVQAHSWALDAGHHVPRDPEPFEHFSIEIPH
jgi:hypothetical protein